MIICVFGSCFCHPTWNKDTTSRQTRLTRHNPNPTMRLSNQIETSSNPISPFNAYYMYNHKCMYIKRREEKAYSVGWDYGGGEIWSGLRRRCRAGTWIVGANTTSFSTISLLYTYIWCYYYACIEDRLWIDEVEFRERMMSRI